MLSNAFALAPLVASRLALFARRGDAAGDEEGGQEPALRRGSEPLPTHCGQPVDRSTASQRCMKHEDSRFEHRTLGPRAAIQLWPRQHIIAVSFSVVH